MKLIRNFTNNDIYFIEVVSDKIVINDNYDGIFILDNELNIITSIKLLKDMVIDTSFIKEKEIVLYCYENQCLVHLNVETKAYKIISLQIDLIDIIFLSLYEWIDDDLVLLAANGTVFIHVNLLENVIYKMQNDAIDKLHFSIRDDLNKLSKLVVHKIYPVKKIAVVEANNTFNKINYKNDTEFALTIKPIKFYDIEVTENCVVQVSEEEISMSYGGKFIKLYPTPEEYRFLRCKFITIDGINYLLLLLCSNADSSICKLERVTLETN